MLLMPTIMESANLNTPLYKRNAVKIYHFFRDTLVCIFFNLDLSVGLADCHCIVFTIHAS